MKPALFITRILPKPAMDILHNYFKVTTNAEDRILEKKEIIATIKDQDALLCLLTDTIDLDVLNAAPKLKAIANYAAGFNNIDIQEATRRKIPVCITPGILTEATADLTWGLILAIARRIPESDQFVRKGLFTGWGPKLFLGSDVYGKTLGIIGMGKIGQAVAKRAFGFNMHVLYAAHAEKNIPNAHWVSLDELLKTADIISIHTPLTKETHHLIGAAQEAVTAPFGNLLVLAGAGSGKTRVLVYRIAWLVHEMAVSPYSVLAVTFTNKAAGEMRGRLESMIGQEGRGMWVGTFHGLSHKMLRLHWKEARLPEHFQVIDGDDQLHMIRRIFKSLAINEDRWEPKKALSFINRKKDEGIRGNALPVAAGSYDQVMFEVYRHYEAACIENGLVDFAELLLRTCELLTENSDLRLHYQARFLHFLVDEFQDTNGIQYQWLSLLAKNAQSVTVVGDDDQSIYGWRGAKVENLRRFEREYKDTCLIRLEQNYRSTETILSAANALIAHNGSRLGKTLWTQEEQGEPISIYAGFNEEDEALYVVRQIRSIIEAGGKTGDIGVLYRSNAQSRVLEEALVRAGIPYSIYGGLRFFERAEIKDTLAYLRLMINPHDNASFERVINVPPRGIGDKSLEKIQERAEAENSSYWFAAKKIIEEGQIVGKAKTGLSSFVQLIVSLEEAHGSQRPLPHLIEMIIRDSGLLRFFREQKGEKAQARAENLEELVNATHDFEQELPEEEKSPVIAFLSYTSLESGDHRRESDSNSVQLMTLHSAKGLEFLVVFICGLEDGLFPHHFSRDNKESLEEERRLCYVGITRAMRSLHLTYAEKRQQFGREEERCASRFLKEIPEQLVQEINRKLKVRPAYGYQDNRKINTISLVGKVFNYAMASGDSLGEGFCLGQRVLHAKFGEGTVLDQEGQGERARIHVQFDTHGSKWLALAYAKLEAVA